MGNARVDSICQQAYQKAQKEQFTKALGLLGDKKCPLLRQYIHWKELRYAKNRASLQSHFDFVRNHPSWPFLHEIRRNIVQRMSKDAADEEILSLFSKALPSTVKGMNLYSQLLKKQGKINQAAKKVRYFWTHHVSSAHDARNFLKTHEKFLRPQEHKKRLDFLLWQGQWKLAKLLLPHLTKEKRLLAEARIALLENKPKVFQSILKKIPQKNRHDEGLLYDHVKWYRRYEHGKALDVYKKARPYIQTHIERWAREKHIIVHDAVRLKNYAKAYDLVSRHQFKKGKLLAQAEWLAGFIAHRFLKKDKQAVGHFSKLLSTLKNPEDLTQAAYWGAKAQKRLRNDRQKVLWLKRGANFPETFYGQLCCEELGLNKCLIFKKNLSVSKEIEKKLYAHPFMDVIRLLHDLGDSGEALPFLYLMMIRTPSIEEKRGIIKISQRYSPENVVDLSNMITGLTDLKVESLYPRLQEVKVEKGMDPAFLHAVIRKESGFNPKATSSADARGMVQIMPATGKDIAQKLKLKTFKVQQLYDKHINLQLAQYYLGEMHAMFDGHPFLVLAAYNAGLGTVTQKWIPLFGDPRTSDIDVLTWIELVPFPETRFYIKKVMANYKIYKKILDKKETSY